MLRLGIGSSKAQQILAAAENAAAGDELCQDLRLSAFEALCEAEDVRGLSFTASSSCLDPDPVGKVCLTKDPRPEHEDASRMFMWDLQDQLTALGLRPFFSSTGASQHSLGSDNRKEPDESLNYKRKTQCCAVHAME